MATAKVYMFNQTNLTANIMVNEGTLFQINGTSDSTQWIPNSSVQTFQSDGTMPGNFNLGRNSLIMNLGNNQTYMYNLDIENKNPGSIELYIFFYDPAQTYAGLIMLYEGGPLSLLPASVIGPAPMPSETQLK